MVPNDAKHQSSTNGVSNQTENHLRGGELQSDRAFGATLVVFSGDLDKAIAAFIIATGAASMGKEVTMLFHFLGTEYFKV